MHLSELFAAFTLFIYLFIYLFIIYFIFICFIYNLLWIGNISFENSLSYCAVVVVFVLIDVLFYFVHKLTVIGIMCVLFSPFI